jgi:hypothetical protein
MKTRISIPNTCIHFHHSLRIFSLIGIFAFSSLTTPAQLAPGDIVFTGYNSDDPDQFSFLATTSISGGEVIYFTDRGYADEIPGWTTAEGILKYTVPPAGLTTGDMIVIENDGGWTILQGSGSIESVSGNFSLANTGDQIFAFQTEDTENYSPFFVAGIHCNYEEEAGEENGITDQENWDHVTAANSDNAMSDLPDDLTHGTDALWFHGEYGTGRKYEFDNGKYNNTITQGTKTEIATHANAIANWAGDNSIPFTLGYPLSTATVVSGTWNESSTWDNGIPGKTTDVTIRHATTVIADGVIHSGMVAPGGHLGIQPEITFTCTDLLTIQSDDSQSGSLIPEGTLVAEVSCERFLHGDRWHLVTPPVSGQEIASFLMDAANNIPLDGSNRAIMNFDTPSNNWTPYFTDVTPGTFVSGEGYAIQRETGGTVTFRGTVLTGPVEVTVSNERERWNLTGNPYPSAIHVTQAAHETHNFLNQNSSSLDPSYTALYLWDEQEFYSGNRNDYKIINNAGSGSLVQNYLQSGQGFFVKTREGASKITFTKEMRTNETGTAYKAGEETWPEILITLHTEDKTATTTLLFNRNMTPGLDVGYDAGAFQLCEDLFLYSRLMVDNGVDFAIQCLPNDFENPLTIPLGAETPEWSEAEFSVQRKEWPPETDIILEDRLNQVSIFCSETNEPYKTILREPGTGRFFLHVGNHLTASLPTYPDNLTVLPVPAKNTLILSGVYGKKIHLRVYDLSGRMVAETMPTGEGKIKMHFADQKNGIYILCMKTKDRLIHKKFLWAR